ncbi:MAG: hypothetical protein ACRCYN_06045 [Plesiomonas sp.]
MYLVCWDFWHNIFKTKKGRSLERWALRQIHADIFLWNLAQEIEKKSGTKYSLELSSIWIDGTPQAHGIARSNNVKCELADLLYIIEEHNINSNVINKKALLLQGKNTCKFNKIDSGSSTHKERTLFEKTDRSKKLVLKSGVQNNAKTIGSYILGGAIPEGLSDCAKFLLMPKNMFWKNKSSHLFPFHVTWPKNEKSADMEVGVSLGEAALKMVTSNEIGKQVIDPNICEWSRLVTDLENGYTGVTMRGYGGQKRINSSSAHVSALLIDEQENSSYFSSQNEQITENMPFISIVKVKVYDRRKD